jgi:hypothetical protein
MNTRKRRDVQSQINHVIAIENLRDAAEELAWVLSDDFTPDAWTLRCLRSPCEGDRIAKLAMMTARITGEDLSSEEAHLWPANILNYGLVEWYNPDRANEQADSWWSGTATSVVRSVALSAAEHIIERAKHEAGRRLEWAERMWPKRPAPRRRKRSANAEAGDAQ